MKRNDLAVGATVAVACLLALAIFTYPAWAETRYWQNGKAVTFDEIEASLPYSELTQRELVRGKQVFPEGVVHWDDDATTPSAIGTLREMKQHVQRTTDTWNLLTARLAETQAAIDEYQGIWDSQQTFLPKAEDVVTTLSLTLPTVTPSPSPTPYPTASPTPTP